MAEALLKLARRPFFQILIVFFFALAIRLVKLDEWGFAQDEGWTIYYALHDWLGENKLVPMPIHFMLADFSMFLFGPTLGGARVLSALVGTLTIPIAYLITRKLSNHGFGLFGAVVLAIHPSHVAISQSCRYLSLASFLSASTVLVFMWAQERQDRFGWLCGILLLALATLTFPPCLVVGGFPLIYFLLRGTFVTHFRSPKILAMSLVLLSVIGFFVAKVLTWWLSLEADTFVGGSVRFPVALLAKVGIPLIFPILLFSFRWKHISLNIKALLFFLAISLAIFTALASVSFISNRYLLWQIPLYIVATSGVAFSFIKPAMRIRSSLFFWLLVIVCLFFLPDLSRYYIQGGFGRNGLKTSLALIYQQKKPHDQVMLQPIHSVGFLLPSGIQVQDLYQLEFPLPWNRLPKNSTGVWTVFFEDYRASLSSFHKQELRRSCSLVHRVASPSQFISKYYEIFYCSPSRT